MATAVGPNRLHRVLRWLLAMGYVAVVALGVTVGWQPRLFWTVLLPLLPVSIVLMGFSNWRRICPLAFFAEIGRLLNRGVQRRVPSWLERWFMPFTFTLLLALLVVRLVATNGDGLWLSGLLVGLVVAAIVVNWIFTGKSWCNFFCPVGLVERVYTEPNSLPHTPSSQCTRCTACKRHCPDIDQENAYWKDVGSRGRRLAMYSFPGLVLAFYVYYWLRAGSWEAYFDGRWTVQPATAELALGPGFFFAPEVPAVWAATLTLVVFSVCSYGLFAIVETALHSFVSDDERRRHLVLGSAAFAAFNIFYVFAGAPTLRHLSGGTRVAAFLAPMVGTVVLVKRWRRTREHFIGDQGVKRLLRSWPFDEPPPSDPAEVYGWIKASRHARDTDLTAYENTVREMIADGLVGAGELRLLEGIRKQLGISEPEHDKILARLSEEERYLFAQDHATGIEERAQLEGYRTALAEALLRGASSTEIDELRERFGVSPEDHMTVLERMRGASGELLSRAARQLDRALQIRHDLATIGATEPTAPRVFLLYLLSKARDEAVDRVLELLEIAGDGPMIQALRRRLFGSDAEKRQLALELLVDACPGSEELVRDLEPLIARRPPDDIVATPEAEAEVLQRLAGGGDPYLRAAAVWASSGHSEASLASVVDGSCSDDHALVRETAQTMMLRSSPVSLSAHATAAPRFSTLSTIETMHFLHAVPLFTDLEPEDLHDLSLFAVEETLEEPEAICVAGDPNSDALFVLVGGRADVFQAEEGSFAERRVGSIGPGEVVGELSVFDGSPRDVSVRPVEGAVRVLRIPGPRLRSGLLRRPRVTEGLFAILASRIRRLSRAVAGNGGAAG